MKNQPISTDKTLRAIEGVPFDGKTVLDLRIFGKNNLFVCEDIESIFDKTVGLVQDRIHPQVVSLFLFSKDGYLKRRQIYIFKDKNQNTIIRNQEWLPEERYQRGQSFSGSSLPAHPTEEKPYGEAHFSNDLDKDIDMLTYGKEYEKKLGFLRCGISIPLNGFNRTFGTLEVINKLDRDGAPARDLTFEENEVYWLNHLGIHVAHAISRIRKKWEDKLVEKISYYLANPRDEKFTTEDVLQEILDDLIESEFSPYKAGTARLQKKDGSSLELVASRASQDINWTGRDDGSRAVGEAGVVCSVVETGEELVVPDIEESIGRGDLLFVNEQWIKREKLKSYIGFPLKLKGEVVGTLSLFTKYVHQFSNSDIDLLRRISYQIAPLILVNGEIENEGSKLESNSSRKQHEEEIRKCLKKTKFDFRTVKGIAKETGIEPAQVKDILETSPTVRKAPLPDSKGNTLYTHIDRPIKDRERLAVAQDILAKFFQ